MKLTEEFSRSEDLAAIKDWMKKQPHLPDEWDDVSLQSFLQCCKFSLERTKRKLDMYFTVRAAFPEFFSDRDITRLELMDTMMMTQHPTMPGSTPDGKSLTIVRGIDKKIGTDCLKDVFKIIFMVCDVKLREQTEESTGEIYILDASVVQPHHLGNLPLSIIKKFFICVQEGIPLRLAQVHLINVTPLVYTAYNILKPFLNDKIRQRIHFHKDCSSLQEYIPKNILPVDYGGTNCSIEESHKVWLQKLTEYRSWFKEQESLKANEALRPGKPKNFEQLYGLDGSFRQLAID